MKRTPQSAPTYISPAQVWPADGKRLAEVSNPYGFLPVTEEILAEIVRRIVAQFDPEKIILFGSYAYGQPNQDSDVDLFIVWNDPRRGIDKEVDISRVVTPRPFPLDVIVRTSTEVTQAIEKCNYFICEIIERGRVLYERSNKSSRLGGKS
jgi:predicted nucleotidyltransferase